MSTIDQIKAYFSLSKEQRDAIDDKDFAGPDKSFPIDTQAHLDAAAHLIGKADDSEAVKTKAIAIAKRKGFTLPESWQKKEKAKMAIFSLTDTVTRKGKIFEIGKDFVDTKGIKFGVSDAEADAAIAKFTPKEINLHHTDSLIDGAIGTIQRVWREGKNILAEYSVSKAFHELTGGKPIPVSSEWDTRTKELTGGAVLLHKQPAVADAIMMAAFTSRHDTREGQYQIQAIHDMAARNGAVCKANNANMSSAHEAKAMQEFHDTATAHGAVCNSTKTKPSYYFCAPTEDAPEDIKPAKPEQQRSNMTTFAEKLKALFSAAPTIEQPTDEELNRLINLGTDPLLAAKFAEQEKQIAKLQAESDTNQAAQFADAVIGSNKALPAERADIIAEFTQALKDDRAYPVKVQFSVVENNQTVVKEGGRADNLIARYQRKPTHKLFDELMSGGVIENGETVIFAHRQTTDGIDGRRNEDKVASKDEIERLKNATPLGRESVKAAARQ